MNALAKLRMTKYGGKTAPLAKTRWSSSVCFEDKRRQQAKTGGRLSSHKKLIGLILGILRPYITIDNGLV